MALIDILRAGVRIADKVTKSAHSTVRYERYLGSTGHGVKTYAGVTTMKAVVDWKQKQVRTQTGVLTVTRASVMLLDIKELLAKTGGDGIGDNDRFTLQDGTTGPILDLGGFIDPGNGIPLATEVFLG